LKIPVPEKITSLAPVSRRGFLQSCAAAALVSVPVLKSWAEASHRGPAQRTLSMDRNWIFGGKLQPAALEPGFADAALGTRLPGRMSGSTAAISPCRRI